MKFWFLDNQQQEQIKMSLKQAKKFEKIFAISYEDSRNITKIGRIDLISLIWILKWNQSAINSNFKPYLDTALFLFTNYTGKEESKKIESTIKQNEDETNLREKNLISMIMIQPNLDKSLSIISEEDIKEKEEEKSSISLDTNQSMLPTTNAENTKADNDIIKEDQNIGVSFDNKLISVEDIKEKKVVLSSSNDALTANQISSNISISFETNQSLLPATNVKINKTDKDINKENQNIEDSFDKKLIGGWRLCV